MSRNRMNHKEEQLYLLGLTLKNAIESLHDDEQPETIKRREWLVALMEVTAKNSPETASFSPFIRKLIPDPRPPF